MASSVKIMNDEMELNLTTVKRLIQPIKSFGSVNAGDAIFQWRLVDTADNLKTKSNSSAFFPINNSDKTAQLNSTFSTKEGQFKIFLDLIDTKKKTKNEIVKTVNRFLLFACDLKLRYSYGKKAISEKRFFAMLVINLNADKHAFTFAFPNDFDAATIVVELYQEALTTIEYRSPYNNVVVGKMERVKEMMEQADHNGLQFVSPRFHLGSGEQLMLVGFWYSKYPVMMADASGLCANLYILSQSGPCVPPFSFTVTFVIFSQKKEMKKDLIHKVFYRQDENKRDFNNLLVFSHELDPYLENDTLYYKVHIEPQPFK